MSRARKVVLNKGVCRVTIYPVQGVPCPGQIECMRIRFVSCCTSMSWLALPLGSQDHSHHMSHGCDAMRWGGTMVWTWEGIASRWDAMAWPITAITSVMAVMRCDAVRWHYGLDLGMVGEGQATNGKSIATLRCDAHHDEPSRCDVIRCDGRLVIWIGTSCDIIRSHRAVMGCDAMR